MPPHGTSVDPPLPPALPDCAINARREILDGGDESPVVDVDRANSIENRLDKLLAYLMTTRPAEEGWAQLVNDRGPETTPKWSEMVRG
jgi:hypothetical protein